MKLNQIAQQFDITILGAIDFVLENIRKCFMNVAQRNEEQQWRPIEQVISISNRSVKNQFTKISRIRRLVPR